MEPHGYWTSEWWLVYITALLALITGALALYTARLFRATVALGKEAKSTGASQAKQMAESIAESARASIAMEKLAANSDVSINAGRKIASQQMRAYLSVVVGNATYQDKNKNLRFAGMPRFVNTGHTPAHKVRYKARAAILPAAIPSDFTFPLPIETVGSSIIGPNHFNEVTIIVDSFVPDDEVRDIKAGGRQALHIWGVVYYDDVFGEEHETKFCHTFTWLGNDKEEIVRGYYNSRHNEAT